MHLLSTSPFISYARRTFASELMACSRDIGALYGPMQLGIGWGLELTRPTLYAFEGKCIFDLWLGLVCDLNSGLSYDWIEFV
jgi:hypothetical protein